MQIEYFICVKPVIIKLITEYNILQNWLSRVPLAGLSIHAKIWVFMYSDELYNQRPTKSTFYMPGNVPFIVIYPFQVLYKHFSSRLSINESSGYP